MPKKKKITQQVSGRSSMRTEDWDSQIIAYCVLHPVSQYYTYMKHILPKKKKILLDYTSHKMFSMKSFEKNLSGGKNSYTSMPFT